MSKSHKKIIYSFEFINYVKHSMPRPESFRLLRLKNCILQKHDLTNKNISNPLVGLNPENTENNTSTQVHFNKYFFVMLGMIKFHILTIQYKLLMVT